MSFLKEFISTILHHIDGALHGFFPVDHAIDKCLHVSFVKIARHDPINVHDLIHLINGAPD